MVCPKPVKQYIFILLGLGIFPVFIKAFCYSILRCIPPWIRTERGFRTNKSFKKFPPDGPVEYWELALLCTDKNPKNRPAFGTIKSTCQVTE